MKLKIKIKEIVEGCMPETCVDDGILMLKSAKNITLQPPIPKEKSEEYNTKRVVYDHETLPFGIKIQLPEGYEANLIPINNFCKKYNAIIGESPKRISNNDELQVEIIAFNRTKIKKFDQICQLEIKLSQYATIWQKIKNLFYSKIEFIKIDANE